MFRYIWPLLPGGIFQVCWNMLLMVPCHGRFDSGFCNWVYGRDCDYGFCGGTVVLACMWSIVGAALIVNLFYMARLVR